MRSASVLPALLLALTPSAALAATPTWSQMIADTGWVSDSDNDTAVGKVHVDTRTISGVQCFRATTTTDASPDKLLAVAADIDSTPRWSSAGVTEAKTLARSGNTLEYYEYLDVPGWTMASDRFWFLTSTIDKTPGNYVFRWDRLTNGGAHKATFDAVVAAHPSAVEPPINTGGWVFSGSGTVTVRYLVCTDSGGSIPTAIQTAATRKTLPDTVADLIKEAKRR